MPNYYDEPTMSDHALVYKKISNSSTCGFILCKFGMLGDKQFIVVNRHSFGGQRRTDPLRRQNDPFSSVPKGSVEQIADGVGGGTGEIADF